MTALACGCVAAAAAILYAATLAQGPLPGAPSALILKHAGGFDAVPPLTHPVWNLLCRLAAVVPAGPLAIRSHALCGVLGVLGVWMAARVAADWAGPLAGSERGTTSNGFGELDGRFRAASSIIAGLSLALSGPFWLASTRTSTGTLAAVLGLAAARRMDAYHRKGGLARLTVAAVLLGLGAAESPALLICIPLAALLTLAAMARHDHLPPLDGRRSPRDHRSWHPAIQAAAAFAAAFLIPPAVQAVVFARSRAAVWAGRQTPWSVAAASLRAIYNNVRDSIPPIGWIVIVLVALVPAALLIWAWRSPAPRRRRRLAAVSVLLLAVSAAIHLHTPLAPWPVVPFPSPPILTYVWVALWTALAANVLMRWAADRWGPSGFADRLPACARLVAAAPVAAVLGGFFLSFPHVDGRAARPFRWLAEGILREAEGAEWMISHGLWDDVVAVTWGKTRTKWQALRWDLATDPVYLASVADRFRDRPYLAVLAEAGLPALVPVWLRESSNEWPRIVAVDLPVVFAASGVPHAPGLFAWRGGTDRPPPPPREIDRWHQEAVAMRRIVERTPPPLSFYGRFAMRHASRVMNEVGVRLEDLGRPEEAIRAYRAAIAADGSNLVAQINLSRVVRSLGRIEAERIDRSLLEYLREIPEPLDIVNLTHIYGRLRDPASATVRAQRLAAAGRFAEAFGDLTAAMTMGGTNDVLMAAAARAMAAQGRAQEALGMLEEGLRQFPNSEAIAQSLAFIAAVERREAATPPPPGSSRLDSLLLNALAAVSRADWAAADTAVRSALAMSPTNDEALALSALLALRQGRPDRVRAVENELRGRGASHPLASLSLAGVLLSERRTAEARNRLDEVVSRHPEFVPARRLLMRLEHEAGRLAAARTHAHVLLRQRPEDRGALLVLADLFIRNERWADAEAIFRRLAGTRSDPVVLSGLAWVLYCQGRAAEAVPHARQAVEAAPRVPEFRYTLASALQATGDWDGALAEITEAMKLAPNNVEFRRRAEQIRDRRSDPLHAKQASTPRGG